MAAIETLLAEGQPEQAGALARALEPVLVLRGLWSCWDQSSDGPTSWPHVGQPGLAGVGAACARHTCWSVWRPHGSADDLARRARYV